MKPIKTFIDGDILVYKIASALEEPIDWGADWWGLYADLRSARQHIDESYGTIVQEVSDAYGMPNGCDWHPFHRPQLDVKIVLSDPNKNWRKAVLPSYKRNRAGKRKPVLWNPLRAYLIDKYKAIFWPGLEADDVIGILASRNSIIVSDDKDFKTIPCLLYQPSSKTYSKVTKRTAERAHLYQTLVGDSADGYKGCPGVGGVGAERILRQGTWGEVLTAYDRAGLGFEEALVQARVAHILNTTKEYKKIGARVRLWHPAYLGKRYGVPWTEDFKTQYVEANA